MFTALAFVSPILSVAAPPVSSVKLFVPPLVIVKLPEAVRSVLVPSDTVPLPAWIVRLPALVAKVLAAFPVRLSAWPLALLMLALEAPPKVRVLLLKVFVL